MRSSITCLFVLDADNASRSSIVPSTQADHPTEEAFDLSSSIYLPASHAAAPASFLNTSATTAFAIISFAWLSLGFPRAAVCLLPPPGLPWTATVRGRLLMLLAC
jgi:hypothetical protein